MWIHWWFLNIPKGHCHWPWAHGALVCSSFLLAQWSSHLQSLFGSEWFCSLHGCFCLQASSLQLCSIQLTVSSSTVYFFSFYLLINPPSHIDHQKPLYFKICKYHCEWKCTLWTTASISLERRERRLGSGEEKSLVTELGWICMFQEKCVSQCLKESIQE